MIEEYEKDISCFKDKIKLKLESSIRTISSNSLNSSFGYYYHYACPNCLTFPIINFNDRQLIIKCKDSNGVKMNIYDYLKYKTKKEELASFDPINEYIGYCFYCKKSFYENNSNVHIEYNFKI